MEQRVTDGESFTAECGDLKNEERHTVMEGCRTQRSSHRQSRPP